MRNGRIVKQFNGKAFVQRVIDRRVDGYVLRARRYFGLLHIGPVNNALVIVNGEGHFKVHIVVQLQIVKQAERKTELSGMVTKTEYGIALVGFAHLAISQTQA